MTLDDERDALRKAIVAEALAYSELRRVEGRAPAFVVSMALEQWNAARAALYAVRASEETAANAAASVIYAGLSSYYRERS